MPGFTFNIARKLFKLENYFVKLMLEREQIHRLHDRIDEMLIDMIQNYAKAGVDSIMFPEDWGTQLQTLINPKLWHEEFYPRFKRLCGIAHDCGIKVFMHSCGAIGAIIPGLIDAGVDLLQFDQPTLHGIDTLASYQEEARLLSGVLWIFKRLFKPKMNRKYVQKQENCWISCGRAKVALWQAIMRIMNPLDLIPNGRNMHVMSLLNADARRTIYKTNPARWLWHI